MTNPQTKTYQCRERKHEKINKNHTTEVKTLNSEQNNYKFLFISIFFMQANEK